MPDEPAIRKRVLLRLAGTPVTVVPFLLGMSSLTAGLAFDVQPALAVFGGIAGVAAAAGVFLTRLILSGERVAGEVRQELELADKEAREKTLDELDERLTKADRDARPETALRDLRALRIEFAKLQLEEVNAASLFEIHSRVEQLFEETVRSIEKTDQLSQMIKKLKVAGARKPLFEQREKIIQEIEASVQKLSETLVSLQNLAASGRQAEGLARVRSELDDSLLIAKRVEQRLTSLVKEADSKSPQ